MSESKLVLFVNNLSSKSRAADLKCDMTFIVLAHNVRFSPKILGFTVQSYYRRLFEVAGPLVEVERDIYDHCALIEFVRLISRTYTCSGPPTQIRNLIQSARPEHDATLCSTHIQWEVQFCKADLSQVQLCEHTNSSSMPILISSSLHPKKGFSNIPCACFS